MTRPTPSYDAKMIRTAATLYSVLESMRSLHGERWPAMVTKHGETLRELATHHDGNVMAAAINAARLPQLASDPGARMVLLAVAVELVEAEGGRSCA